MDIFRSPSPSPIPRPELPSTPTTKKTLQKPTLTKNKNEIQTYDQIILDARAANPPVPWKEIETTFRAVSGVTTGFTALKNNRYPALKALGEEMSSEEIEKLVAAETLIAAEMEKEKWSRIAAHLEAEEGGKTWNAKFLKRTFTALPKSAF